MTKKKFFLALILIILGALFVVVGIKLGGKPGFYLDNTGLHFYENDVLKKSITENLTFKNMEIDFEATDVNIYYSDIFKIDYTSSDQDKLTYKLVNNTLKLENKANKGIRFFDMGLKKDFDNKLDIYLPYDLNMLKIELDAGNVSLDSSTLNILEIENEVGNVNLNNITLEYLAIELNAGNISLNKVNSHKSILELEVGNINTTDFTTDNLLAKLSLGDLNLKGTFGFNTKIEANLGDVTVDTTLPKNSYGYLLNTSFGNITIDGKKQSKKVHDNLNTNENYLEVENSFGDIKVNFN